MDKRHIIEEIRRTARNGVPLGRALFGKATGIRDSDWQGRYWARWSEAVREAGLEPNPWNVAIDESLLLERLVALIRQLGHFPVSSELRLKSYQDPTFPNDKTFFSRFGSKHKMVAAVRMYCEAHPEYHDVVTLCPEKPNASVDFSTDDNKELFGFVYLLKSGRYYKVGRSNAVGRRERELAIQLPDRATTVHSIKTDDPAGIESYWHQRFEAKRKNGEWFELDASDVKAFKRRTFM